MKYVDREDVKGALDMFGPMTTEELLVKLRMRSENWEPQILAVCLRDLIEAGRVRKTYFPMEQTYMYASRGLDK